jgi:signal transduction histidine kinase
MNHNLFPGIGYTPPRFPLLLVAIVSALFAVLFFVMATMDLRRVEYLLYDMLENQGISQIGRLGESAVLNFQQLVYDEADVFSAIPMMPIEESDLSIHGYLVTELVDLARDIEQMERSIDFSEAIATDLAEQWHISRILFYDREGNSEYDRSTVHDYTMFDAEDLLHGNVSVSLKLFEGGRILRGEGYVGIARTGNDAGAVTLWLDGDDLRYWAWKISLERAVQNQQWLIEPVYLGVFGDNGSAIVGSGNFPEPGKGARFPDFVSVKQGNTLEVISVFDQPETPRSLVVMGLSMEETAGILSESRRHIIVSTGLMVAIGMTAMGILYNMQNRHINKVRMMTDQLNTARRLSSLGKLGAGLAHEIRNPLNSISMAAQRLAREFPASGENKRGYDRITEVISLESQRLNNLVNDFLALSSSGRLRLRAYSVKEVVSRVVFLLRPEAREKGICIDVDASGIHPEIMIDPDRLEQALLNIVRNGIEAIVNDGRIMISMRYIRGFAVIRVMDNGPGISESDIGSIFDPSFTTREKGVGLGLSIAHEIITAHNGRIGVRSGKEQGTTFEVFIPIRNDQQQQNG